MTLYLVRHANAGSRRAWEGDQDDRPLSERGIEQANHLTACLADQRVAAVWSSPAVRCVQTVEGVASAAGIAVDVEAFLGEGCDAGKAVLRLVERAGELDGALVACSHGDLIPRAVSLLVADGLRIDGPEGAAMCKKGSMWEIQVNGGRAVTARYLPPGA